MREFTPNRPANVRDLNKHIGEYIAFQFETRKPERIVFATKTELRTENGTRIKVSVRNGLLGITQSLKEVGGFSAPKIVTAAEIGVFFLTSGVYLQR